MKEIPKEIENVIKELSEKCSKHSVGLLAVVSSDDQEIFAATGRKHELCFALCTLENKLCEKLDISPKEIEKYAVIYATERISKIPGNCDSDFLAQVMEEVLSNGNE